MFFWGWAGCFLQGYVTSSKTDQQNLHLLVTAANRLGFESASRQRLVDDMGPALIQKCTKLAALWVVMRSARFYTTKEPHQGLYVSGPRPSLQGGLVPVLLICVLVRSHRSERTALTRSLLSRERSREPVLSSAFTEDTVTFL